MDQEIKDYLDQLEKQLTGLFAGMEKRLEEKIENFIRQSRSEHNNISEQHRNFQADIKQLYGRTDLLEKNHIMVEGRVKNLEELAEKKEVSGRFRWEIAVALGSIAVAIISVIFGGGG